MVAGSILPVSIHNGKLYFLFGKENPMEDSSKGWSDFGGGVEAGETPYQTCLREGSEELSGFLGDAASIDALIKKGGGVYELVHNDYHVHIFQYPYDENLSKYYNQNHSFLWNRMDNQVLNDTKLFEKIEIDWFSLSDLKTRRKEFREFYQEIVDLFLTKSKDIHKFIRAKYAKRRTTLKKKHLTIT